MTAKCNVFENEILKAVFQNDAGGIPLIGDATGFGPTATAGSLYCSMHTADPGEAGNQTTSEIAYTGYARVAVARSAAGFTVTDNSVSPAAAVVFGESTDLSSFTCTHIGIGTASTGAGKLLYRGAVSPSIAVLTGTIPRLKTTSAVTED